MPLNIAMDGPVGAGKSSIANAVAQRLNILHLDTGAMYRTIGLAAIRQGIDLQDEAAVTILAQTVDISVRHGADGQHTLLAGEDVSGLIRTEQADLNQDIIHNYSEEEQQFRDLWLTFFDSIAIKARTNPKLQAQNIPKRFWPDALELARMQ